jgi:glutamyl-tRNA synthetase
MPIFYEYAGKLFKKGKLYVCTCAQNKIKDNRAKGNVCSCRNRPFEENIRLWYAMLTKTPEGKAVVRLKADMKSLNMDLRDPAMFRIVKHPHVLQGKKYRVWPTYDFANSIEDAICGITHVLRSAEFEQRSILQALIRKHLNLKEPEMVHYSRIGLQGAPTSKRKIRELIKSKIVSEWDDPRLATIKGLKRRGILPETFKELALIIGITKSQPTIEWKLLLSVNRKFLDPIANRYFVVKDPIKLKIEAPPILTKLINHPEFPERGKRRIATFGKFYIDKSDVAQIRVGDKVRLKDLYNFRVKKIGKNLVEGVVEEMKIDPNVRKIHWVTEDFVKVKIIIPGILLINDKPNPESWQEITAYGEKALADLKVGDQIQMERFGFARVDSVKPLKLIFTSK